MSKRPITTHALAAKAIRALLRETYPAVPFTVRARSFAGGDAVDVSWTDGPTSEAVRGLLRPYEYGSFDPMQDLYEYDNQRDDLPQVKYVQERRDHSHDAERAMVALINRRFGLTLTTEVEGSWLRVLPDTLAPALGEFPAQYVRRELHKLSLLCPGCGARVLPGDRFCPANGEPLTREGFPVLSETGFERGEARRYLRVLRETGGTFAVALYDREGVEWSAREGIKDEPSALEVFNGYARDLFREKFTVALVSYAALHAQQPEGLRRTPRAS